jgi:hypothetical protein
VPSAGDSGRESSSRSPYGTVWLTQAKEVHMAERNLVSRLKTKHANLELAIENEMARPLPDEEALAALKRKKLQIKDELLKLHAA